MLQLSRGQMRLCWWAWLAGATILGWLRLLQEASFHSERCPTLLP